MDGFIKQNWFRLIIAISLLVVALSIGYYFVIYVPGLSAEKLADQKAQQRKEEMENFNNELGRIDCLKDADNDYDAYVKLNGIKQADGSFRATADIWDRAKKDKQLAIDNCYRKYPQK